MREKVKEKVKKRRMSIDALNAASPSTSWMLMSSADVVPRTRASGLSPASVDYKEDLIANRETRKTRMSAMHAWLMQALSKKTLDVTQCLFGSKAFAKQPSLPATFTRLVAQTRWYLTLAFTGNEILIMVMMIGSGFRTVSPPLQTLQNRGSGRRLWLSRIPSRAVHITRPHSLCYNINPQLWQEKT
ncbi:uncharacterized protein EDB91DRAFT_1076409 [Suillus paluster]|uniref:uncharacterized protein n=1 Tax=Suillus paluster TaxID=48578 RepID=UPI001B881D6B|nr:uncharacterized protein EDB91DRAFT_1076409 [Suillus paluster]KAG1756356.1 hypothetical protein EDB91DRAFT_1076409 [Suillus paluster]